MGRPTCDLRDSRPDGNDMCADCSSGERPGPVPSGVRPALILALAIPGLIFLPLAIAAAVLGARYRRNVESGVFIDSKTASLGFVLGGAGVIVGVLQLFALVYLLPAILNPSTVEANEAAAVSALSSIEDAQSRHLRLTGGYAESIGLLRERGFLQNDFKERSGYRFEMTASDDFKQFEARACPVKPGISGRRYFFIDHRGLLRASERPGVDGSSPVVSPTAR